MKMAFLCGSIGILFSTWVGSTELSLDFVEIAFCILAANFGALVSILTTLRAEKIQWVKKYVLNGSLRTWTFLIFIYLGILLGLTPILRETPSLLKLFVPLALSTGFAIILFGPIQDRLVAREQKKHQRIKHTETDHTQTDPLKNDFPCFPTDSAML